MYYIIFATVSPLTTLLPSSIDQLYDDGNNATLQCSSEGGPNNTYQWQVNGSNITGATLPVLMLADVRVSDGGEYTCVVSNAAGSDEASTSLYVSLTFITEPLDTLTSYGSTATLECEAEAFPSPEYQWWRVDGELIRNAIMTDSNVLVIGSVRFGDEGDYYCNASSLEFSIQSQFATLTGTCIT